MPPRKKKQEEPEKVEDLLKDETKALIQEVSINDLFECLKEFDNKVLLERLKVLERSIALLYKEQLNTISVLKEMQQVMINLSLSHEELLNGMGLNPESQEEIEEKIIGESEIKVSKKWN